MIRRVVSMQLGATDTLTRLQHAHEIKKRLEALADVTDGILAINVFFDSSQVSTFWPVILVADYASAQSLDNYQSHSTTPRRRGMVE